MKDLFSGSLGRLNNHGGSRMFTTPNTISVPPEYEVETDVPSVAEFVTCTLDGRIWIYRRSRRYYIAVLRWDEETKRLVFVSTTILNNINIIGRGIDWVLTDTMIIQASDNEPYIFTANLFADNETSFLYSVLSSNVVLKTNFDKFLVSKHYSQLHSVGDWNIIKNFLVRRADNPLSDAHNSMLNLRPLIPLEFRYKYLIYNVGLDINLTYFNGELWGRGLYHIGKCYILPAVFSEDGTPQEFYLYINPDYQCMPYNNKSDVVTKTDWLNLGVLHTDETVYGFLCKQADSLDDGLCYSPETPKLFVPSANEWQELSENSNMFVDTLNNSGLVLHENSVILLNGNNPSYECKGFNQWLAPSGKVDAVSSQYVISSFDNGTLATYPQQGLHREFLTKKIIPLTAKNYSGKRLSLGLNDKTVQVNSMVGHVLNDSIDWQDIFKNYISIELTDKTWMPESIRPFEETSPVRNVNPIKNESIVTTRGKRWFVYYGEEWTDELPPKHFIGTYHDTGVYKVGTEIRNYTAFNFSQLTYQSFSIVLNVYQRVYEKIDTYDPLCDYYYNYASSMFSDSILEGSYYRDEITVKRWQDDETYKKEIINIPTGAIYEDNEGDQYIRGFIDDIVFINEIQLERGIIFFILPYLGLAVGIKNDDIDDDDDVSFSYWNFGDKSLTQKIIYDQYLCLKSVHYIHYKNILYKYTIHLSPDISYLYSQAERSNS